MEIWKKFDKWIKNFQFTYPAHVFFVEVRNIFACHMLLSVFFLSSTFQYCLFFHYLQYDVYLCIYTLDYFLCLRNYWNKDVCA